MEEPRENWEMAEKKWSNITGGRVRRTVEGKDGKGWQEGKIIGNDEWIENK